ncbi:MAG: hypothetical protein WBY53_05120 [Acidobacteriaceae bacterium]
MDIANLVFDARPSVSRLVNLFEIGVEDGCSFKRKIEPDQFHKLRARLAMQVELDRAADKIPQRNEFGGLVPRIIHRILRWKSSGAAHGHPLFLAFDNPALPKRQMTYRSESHDALREGTAQARPRESRYYHILSKVCRKIS